jgi:hypothetical protein
MRLHSGFIWLIISSEHGHELSDYEKGDDFLEKVLDYQRVPWI